MAEAAARVATASRECERKSADLQKARNALPLAEQREQEAQVARARLPGLEAERVALQGQIEAHGRRRAVETRLVKEEKLLGEAKAAADALRLRGDECRGAAALEQTRWDEGQAALLAASLTENNPCPVCGSTHHPSPAHAAGGEVPSEARLKVARAAVTEIEAKLQRALDAQNQQSSLVAGLRAEAQALPIPASPAEALAARLEEVGREQLNARAKLAAAPEGAVAAARAKLEAVQAESAVADQARQSALAARDRLQAALDALGRDLPDALRAPGAMETRRRQLAQELAKLEASRAAAARDSQTAAEKLRSVDARIEELTKAKDGHVASVAHADAEWRESRNAAGFDDDSAWQAAIIDPATFATREQDLRDFERELSATMARLARAEAAIAEAGPRPDLEALRDTARIADEALQTALSERAKIQANLVRLTDARQRLDKLDAGFAEIEAAYAVAGKVAEAVGGKNSQGITLQRFVLTAFLDDTLVAASARLVKMSRGRYRLGRRLERADQRRAAGLDLDVLDEHTGLARPVSTLSGGESFLASLALALGLADVVQSYAGGLRLDALFVDEGFGTLDPEALDEAMKVLVDLRENGRLVGIISHVPELKDRIDVRLEVTSTRAGSTARFTSR